MADYEDVDVTVQSARERALVSDGLEQEATMRDLDVQDVLNMELVELMALCEKLGITSDDFVADSEFQSAILDHMKARRLVKSSFPPFADAASAFARDVEAKRRKFVDVIDRVKRVLFHKRVTPWLEKLNVHNIPRWMKKEQLDQKRDSVEGKPVLLIAGSTSAGKSTLANALLGDTVLPTSHNASTAVVCELKYSGKPGKKHAVVHFERGRETRTEELDLMTADGCSRFADCLAGTRVRMTSEPTLPSHFSCVRAEIFWPLDFLKNFTLVDSPGVTEGEGESVTRQITEQFQRDLACGFIYVLDATRAVEEAAQVGGLLRAVVKATNSLPSPGSALFVVNKWDLLVQQLSTAEQEQFLHRMGECLAARWPGFDASKQLITMNAKLAAQAQQLGSTTDEIRTLCNGIVSILPSGVNYMLLRGVSHPMELLDEVDQITDSAVRTLAMPPEERARKLDSDWQRLESFKKSREDGALAQLSVKIRDRIDELVTNMSYYLRSEDGMKLVLQSKDSELSEMAKEWFAIADVRGVVEKGFIEAVCQYKGYTDLCKWIQNEVGVEVHDLLTQLMAFKGEMGASLVRQASCTSLAAEKSEDPEIRKSTLFRSLAIALMVLPINWPGLLVNLGMAMFSQKDSKSPNSQRRDLIASNWLLRRIHRSMYWRTIERAYQGLVDKACESNGAMLRQIITDHLVANMEVVQILFKELPGGIQAVEQELIGRSKQKEVDMQSFVAVLEEIRQIKSVAAHFVVLLKSPTFKRENVKWVEPRAPVARGTYGPIYRATMIQHGKIAVEEMETAVSDKNSDELYYMISVGMKLSHRNLRKFYGTTAVSKEPLRLGLVMEWSGDMTLSTIIFGKAALTQTSKLTLALQILNAVRYLHGMGVVHGDLLPESIMVVSDLVVKVGCVCSVRATAHRMSSEVVHALHTAPEILLGYPFGISADIFSVGVLLWEIWHGTLANWYTSGMGSNVLAEGIKQGTVLPSTETHEGEIQAVWVSVWENCWSAAPDDRLTASGAYDTLKVSN